MTTVSVEFILSEGYDKPIFHLTSGKKVNTSMKFDRLGEMSRKRDCWQRLTVRQPKRRSSSESIASDDWNFERM